MKIVTYIAVFSLSAALGLAETWSGKLVDAACKDQSKSSGASAQCAPTKSTLAFGLELPDGKFVKFDGSGNTKAASALKTKDAGTDARAKVTGELDGQTVKVESIEVE